MYRQNGLQSPPSYQTWNVLISYHLLWQSDALTTRLDMFRSRLDLIRTRLDLIRTRLDLIRTRLDLIRTRLNLILILYSCFITKTKRSILTVFASPGITEAKLDRERHGSSI